MLYTYLEDVQRFIRDTTQAYVSPSDLIDYVNRARRNVAERSQCIRVLAPISGAVTQITMVNKGAGYSATPTVTISPPDFPSGDGTYPAGLQAQITPQVTGGQIINISVDQGGAGYFQPVITIADATGSGAIATAAVSPIAVSAANREVYKFSDVPLDNFPGYGSIIAVRSVSFIYANYRYSLPCYPFSTYQAMIRQYPQQYLYVPTMCAQFGQGANGSLYMYPIPSSVYQMEWDATCLPQDLDTDDAVEAIPMPWQDSVAFCATHYAYLGLQNLNAAAYYWKQYNELLTQHGVSARPGRATNPYGRF